VTDSIVGISLIVPFVGLLFWAITQDIYLRVIFVTVFLLSTTVCCVLLTEKQEVSPTFVALFGGIFSYCCLLLQIVFSKKLKQAVSTFEMGEPKK